MREKLIKLIQTTTGHLPEIQIPERGEFGHFSTNLAMKLARQEKKNPMEIGAKLIDQIKARDQGKIVKKAEVVPPGFINFWLTEDIQRKEFLAIAKADVKFGRVKSGQGKKVIVEFSQPNIAKRMHVGHLRNTILGEVISKVLVAAGYRVTRWNYLGDWGTQFGKLIVAYRRWGKRQEVEKAPIETLMALYIRFHQELKNDPALEDEGRKEFSKLEKGDKENRKLWEWFKKESLLEFEKIYKLLNIKFDTYIGEAFYEKRMGPVVADLLKRKIAEKSEGAVIVPLEKFDLPPALVQKSDGSSLYLTRDIANLQYRLKEFKPAKILIVVGNEQTLHFQQVFAVGELLGLAKTCELRHIKYGLVLDEGGQKFATREGRVVLASQVIEKGIKLARDIVEQKNAGLNEKEKEKIASGVALAGISYTMLKENKNSDITFNWQQMLSMSGESGPYLQYTYSRLKSILRKSGKTKIQPSQLASRILTKLNEPELAITRKLSEFPQVVEMAADKYAVNLICLYLYQLANLVNSWYESTPGIIVDEDANRKLARLSAIQTAAGTLRRGMEMLGITALERI